MLSCSLQLLTKVAFLGGERHELFMPELEALRLRQRRHTSDHGFFPPRYFINLAYEGDNLRHVLPSLRVMAALEVSDIDETSMTILFASHIVELYEPLELLVVGVL